LHCGKKADNDSGKNQVNTAESTPETTAPICNELLTLKNCPPAVSARAFHANQAFVFGFKIKSGVTGI
jgi:hypothetical protein